MEDQIILYGSSNCHKTKHYQEILKSKNLIFLFNDVIKNEEKAKELKSLYKSGKLNFPTLKVGGKKLRNPTDLELDISLIKKGFIKGTNFSKDLKFSCGIDSSRHDCGDAIEY
jgi:glutaredoxin